jgi:hypothetical protein
VNFRRSPKIGRDAMLKSRPARNDALEWEKNDSEEISITLVRGTDWKARILSKIFWIPERRTLLLDQIGAQVWEMCDGKTSVDAMIRSLSETHKLNLKEAEVSLLSYLQNLGKKRLVGFLVDKADLPKSKKNRPNASGKAWGA